MITTTIAVRILSSSSSFMFSPKPPSLLPTLLLRRPLSILSSTMATVNSNSFAASLSPIHHQLTRGTTTNPAASTSSNPTGVWPLPLRVSSLEDEWHRRPRTCTCGFCSDCRCIDHRHWLAIMPTNGFHIQTEEALFDLYIKAIANAIGR
ncbi:hypothetical protein FRX31_028025 [Thalictrum thalictroides]|uniref:Uncharacterized protein n=1 Tax=Thalictrum thalictroides TaxID=46969 RepID=A0A7J6VCR1_THATH|nr:hypothetical protein FRX31_028025 [Thalictrum thalictroides]